MAIWAIWAWYWNGSTPAETGTDIAGASCAEGGWGCAGEADGCCAEGAAEGCTWGGEGVMVV